MTIELISKEEYNRLLEIQKEYPSLTFNNDGYEYINKEKLTEADKKALEEVTQILDKSIVGFREFNNFQLKNNKIKVRFQFEWTADEEEPRIRFIGVGYLHLEELLNGFNNKEK